MERELDGYLNWIEKAEEIILTEGDENSDGSNYDMRKQHYRNNANYQMSSDSEDCMTEFGGAGDSFLVMSCA